MDRCEKLAILVVDDQDELLDLYDGVLRKRLGHRVDCVSMPAEAMRHVRETLFDIAVIDAKITYKNAPLGGLLLAEEIGRILGIGSVIVVSQYDVRAEVRAFNSAFTFLSKPKLDEDLADWLRSTILERTRRMVQKQYGFVAMPFRDPQCKAWYEGTLQPWMMEAGFEIRRIDEIPTTRAINQEVQDRIRHAHFVMVYAPKNNPNVFFEAGFAIALDKFVIVLSQGARKLPFDIRPNHSMAIAGATDDDSRAALVSFIYGLRDIPT